MAYQAAEINTRDCSLIAEHFATFDVMRRRQLSTLYLLYIYFCVRATYLTRALFMLRVSTLYFTPDFMPSTYRHIDFSSAAHLNRVIRAD